MTTSARQPDVIVVGAGLHGLSAALHLARAGLKPLVLEKDYPGRHASGVNAGGVRRLGRHLAEVPLSVEAMKVWHEIAGLVDDDCDFVRCGQIKIAETEAEFDRLGKRAQEVRTIGFDHEEIIGRDELRQHIPAIAPHCVGGMICRDDGAALPFRTVIAFARRARALGAEIREGCPVTSIRRESGIWHVEAGGRRYEAPVIVNAAGAWAGHLAAMAGDPVPLQAQAPMLMITERVAPFIKPVVGAAGRTLSFKQFDNGTVLIGGGLRGHAVPERNLTSIRLAEMRTSAQTVGALFPKLAATRIVRFWAGIEAVMPDEIPVIGKSPNAEGLFHSFGYSAHGFQLAPVTGRIIADLVMHGHTGLPIEAFRPDRFNTRGEAVVA
ncbi:MAG: FAD-binding oxidoreductase [Rhodobiaceae bacterium]|nr:FAD-binding oxidoreductase [Rhodobiaceae bacterium]MCC0040772.1 FAD-binding oxidoreductase [Rhodobiaceae bacterium]MCC0053599.1 FAD-binding oxidoreductase [Rhodobiaceae bacterium]